MTTAVQHLWDHDHPYYCNEGNYYERGMHDTYSSWAEFYEAWGDADEDYNCVFRWDWKVPDPADYADYDGGPPVPPQRLFVYWVLQRKAILRSTECVVTADDEPEVRAWLANRAAYMASIWAPLLPQVQG